MTSRVRSRPSSERKDAPISEANSLSNGGSFRCWGQHPGHLVISDCAVGMAAFPTEHDRTDQKVQWVAPPG